MTKTIKVSDETFFELEYLKKAKEMDTVDQTIQQVIADSWRLDQFEHQNWKPET